MKRRLDLDPRSAPLPKGTRVVLLDDAPSRDGWTCKAGTAARVEEVDHPRYTIGTPDGRHLDVARDVLVVQSGRLEDVVTERAWAWETFAPHVVLEVVVGSTAWGLAGPDSDEDVRGVFLLPFEAHVSLFRPPDELAPAGEEAQYWEVEKLIRAALRADANALEALWTPHVKRSTPVGDRLRAARDVFTSRRIHGSFGRYALGQLEKMRRKLEQRDAEQRMVDALHGEPDLSEAALVDRLVHGGLGPRREAQDLVRRVRHAFFDRGLIPSRSYEDLAVHLATSRPVLEPFRPKNAYNLLRLLHSGIRWATVGEPLIRVDDPDVRARLLAVKAGNVPLDDVVAEARALAAAFDDAVASSSLPEEPDLDAADALLRSCRTDAARRSLGIPSAVA